MKKTLICFVLFCQSFVFTSFVLAEKVPEIFSLTLEQAQAAAGKNSHALQAANFILESAKAQTVSAAASLYPRLDINGNYFYQTHIPTQTSAGSSIKMGDNDNYSIAPVISYTLFDAGKTINNVKSARLNAAAKEQDFFSRKRDIRQAVNLTYARVQFYSVNLAQTMDALTLSQQQSADIDLRFKVGTASRLDQISAHKETLNYKLLFYQAQNDLAYALRDLLALTGDNSEYQTERPLPAEIASKLSKDINAPTLIISIDPLEKTLNTFLSAQEQLKPLGESTPQIKALSLSAESLNNAYRSQKAANWPKITLSAESITAYPDLSRQEQYNNNVFSVSVSFPLWDTKQNSGMAKKILDQAKAVEQQKAQALSDLNRDNAKAADAIASLQARQSISDDTSKEAAEIARLTYQSYSAGKSTFLEVQSANLKLIQARVNTARIEFDLINQLAAKEYLSGEQDQRKENNHAQ